MSYGLKHKVVGTGLDQTEWEVDDSHLLAQGMSFPVSPSPALGDRFFRTDLYKWFVYNGTKWRGLNELLFNDRLIYLNGEGYPPTGGGLQDALNDASALNPDPNDVIFLPQGLIPADDTITVSKRVHIIGPGKRHCAIEGTVSLGSNWLFEYTSQTSCRAIHGFRAEAYDLDYCFRTTATADFPVLRCTEITFDGLVSLGHEENQINALNSEFRKGGIISAVSGPVVKLMSCLLFSKAIRPALTLNNITAAQGIKVNQIQGCIFRQSEIDIRINGIADGKTLIVGNIFLGAWNDDPANTHDSISLEGATTGGTIITGNCFHGTAAVAYRDCVRLGGTTDYAIIKDNIMKEAYGTNKVNNISGNANGIITDNLG